MELSILLTNDHLFESVNFVQEDEPEVSPLDYQTVSSSYPFPTRIIPHSSWNDEKGGSLLLWGVPFSGIFAFLVP